MKPFARSERMRGGGDGPNTTRNQRASAADEKAASKRKFGSSKVYLFRLLFLLSPPTAETRQGATENNRGESGASSFTYHTPLFLDRSVASQRADKSFGSSSSAAWWEE